MKILAITGRAYHGKSTLANQIEMDAVDFSLVPYKTAFAKKLKEVVKELLEVEKLPIDKYTDTASNVLLTFTELCYRIENWIKNLEKKYNTSFNHIDKDDLVLRIHEVASFCFTYHHAPTSRHLMSRLVLQKFGTDIGRYLVPGVWIDFLIKDLQLLKSPSNTLVIIDDVRFADEFAALQRVFGETELVGVVRDGLPIYNHASEVEINELVTAASYVVENASLDDLPATSQEILNLIIG